MTTEADIIEHIDAGSDPGCRYMPTPEQIRAECLAIQAEWSAHEELRRRAVKPSGGVYLGGVVRFGE